MNVNALLRRRLSFYDSVLSNKYDWHMIIVDDNITILTKKGNRKNRLVVDKDLFMNKQEMVKIL